MFFNFFFKFGLELEKHIRVFMTIGQRLKNVRGNILQKELARRLGVHVNTLAGYERDQKQPDADYLNRVLAMFPEISPEWLLTGAGLMKRVLPYGQAGNGNGMIQGDDNELHIEIHAEHPMRRDADRAMEHLLTYASDPLMTLMVGKFSKLSEPQKYDVLKYMAELEKAEG